MEINKFLGSSMSSDHGQTILDDSVKVKLPKKFHVILHNDDYTTMEFVIFVLKAVFHKSGEVAEKIMWDIHKKGHGVCGTYVLEIAESKVEKVYELAKIDSQPLKCTIEPAEL